MTTPYGPDVMDPTAKNEKTANGDNVSYTQQLMEYRIRTEGVKKS